jgi:hypothetical protein
LKSSLVEVFSRAFYFSSKPSKLQDNNILVKIMMMPIGERAANYKIHRSHKISDADEAKRKRDSCIQVIKEG